MNKVKKNVIADLIEVAPVFAEGSAIKKNLLLKDCANVKLNSKKTIERYHDCLLFLLGYAENEELYLLAQQEMERLSESVKKLPRHIIDQLERTGIAYTQTQAANSFTLIKWLLKTYPGQVTLHSLDEEGVHPKEVLRYALSEMEFEFAFTEKLNPLKWLENACLLYTSDAADD